MLNKLFTELKMQSQEVSNQYIVKVEKIFKTANISYFRDTVLLATLVLVQKVFQMDSNAAQKYVEQKADDPYVSHALDNALESYYLINLESCTAIELLTYVLFSEPDTKKDSDFNSGDSINKLLTALLTECESVTDLGFGYGQLLLFSALYGNAKQLTGIEVEADCYVITRVRLSLLPNEPHLHLIYGNIFNEEDLNRLSSKKAWNTNDAQTTVIHPPFGSSLSNFTEDNSHLSSFISQELYDSMSPAAYKSEWPFILTALERLTPGKKLFAITTNGAASTETYSAIRKELIRRGYVNCVMQLSENLLPGTSIPSTLWIFSKGNETVRVIDASQIRTEGRRKFTLSDENISEIMKLITFEASNSEEAATKDIVKDLTLSEIEESNYNLSPSRHVGADFLLEYIQLKDVCQINRGIILKAQELDELVADNNSIKYITPKHLNNGVIDLSKVTSLAETDEIFKKKSIDDDSIVMSKLLPFKTGYVRQVKKKQVFSNGNTYYLQINQKAINPLFLFMYLNSTMAQKQLEQLSRGSSTSTLSISDLKELKIPLVKRSIQDKLADNYKKLIKEEQRIQASLDKLEKNKRRLIEEVLS